MGILFVVAGMSARYALEEKTPKEFIRERVRRLLIPSIAGIFILGWIPGLITNHYADIFAGNREKVPALMRFIIYCLIGIGPLWFSHELFLASMILLLILFFDKKKTLLALGKRTNITTLLLLVFPVWWSAQIMNTPVIEVYRNGFYIFLFLLGYFIFSHENVTDITMKYKIPFIIVGSILGVIYTVYYFGENITKMLYLKNFFTNLYAWIMILALLGCFKAWFNKRTKFTVFMNSNCFSFYVLHYPIMVLITFCIVEYTNLPIFAEYILVLFLEVLCLPTLTIIVKKLPIVRFLLLGEGKKQNK